MINLAEELDARVAGTGEAIEAAVIGLVQGKRDAEVPVGRVLSWAEARPWLDFRFDEDYPRTARPVFAYTKSWILFFVGNDERGGSRIEMLPRHPTPSGCVEWFVW